MPRQLAALNAVSLHQAVSVCSRYLELRFLILCLVSTGRAEKQHACSTAAAAAVLHSIYRSVLGVLTTHCNVVTHIHLKK